MDAKTCVDPLDVACHTNVMTDSERFPITEKRVVRVVQQFRPSGHLLKALSEFSGAPLRRERVGVFSSVNALIFPEKVQSKEVKDAEYYFEHNNESLYLKPQVALKQVALKVGQRATRIALAMKDQDQLERITEHVARIPSVDPHTSEAAPYVFLDIARQPEHEDPVFINDARTAFGELVGDTSANRLHSLETESILYIQGKINLPDDR